MPAEPRRPGAEGEPRTPLWKRLVWFGGLWLAGLAAIGVVAAILRAGVNLSGTG